MYRKIAGITYFPAFIGFLFLMNLRTCNISNNDHSEAVQKSKKVLPLRTIYKSLFTLQMFKY